MVSADIRIKEMKPENPLLDFQVSASTIRFPRFRIMDAHEKSGIDGV